MTQRLVDIVDHSDVEHDGFELDVETPSPSNLATILVMSRSLFETLETPTLEGSIVGSLEFTQIGLRATQRAGSELLGPELNLEGSHLFSLFVGVQRPGHTLEDLAIIETIPGL